MKRSAQSPDPQALNRARSRAWFSVSTLVIAVCSVPTFNRSRGDEFFPIVSPDWEVSLFAEQPLVQNPCAIAFDAQGRLCVGMGPQYRNPRPNTPGDSVYILIDGDGDGKADTRREFARGLNCIQGLAWSGNELWIANAPDLTVVRDLDGDDEADEYIRLYTDLGNLEHGLHGLNWAPDGKLYMSKGNSKGLTRPPDRVAPRPFRELWGVDLPGLPDFPRPGVFTKQNYQKNYHDPQDDWGREGGILRCDPDGENLEIVARGFRNPWDITFDDGFNWLGTDNDQTLGDKIFSPFYGAHFGWGHPWSFDWSGEDHLPTVPASGPLFEGSGAGVIFCGIERYPATYRGVFLINDWLRREVYIYRPKWDGARLIPKNYPFELLASAGTGRSMERSAGRKFDPVDIEIGPDEAVYISSWGRQYGAEYEGGRMINEGRIYRLWPKEAPPIDFGSPERLRPIEERSVSALLKDLGSHLPVWRVNAQEELIRRRAKAELLRQLEQTSLPERLETWIAWTLGRIDKQDEILDALFTGFALSPDQSVNRRLQSIRILAYRGRLPEAILDLFKDPEPRIRFETVLAIRQAGTSAQGRKLADLAAVENDRLVYYAVWGALRHLLPESELNRLLDDPRPGVRRAALLALLEDDRISSESLRSLAQDPDPATSALACRRLAGKSEAVIRGRPLLALRPAPSSVGKDGPASGGSRTTVADALGAMQRADPNRGRALFMESTGAGCAACHRFGEQGNAFAPDLTDIATRADADFIVRSIIDPNAAITEGFVTQTFVMNDGAVYSGILLEETGAAVKIVLASAETVILPCQAIALRQASSNSAMPSNYAELLDAQQIADIAAFLIGSPAVSGPVPSPASSVSGFRFKLTPDGLEVYLAAPDRPSQDPVAVYLFRHPELTRPAFVNVRTVSGARVTREFPAPPEADHRWMHPGIAMSFGWLDGQDYWRMRAKVEHVEFVRPPEANENGLAWTVKNRYLSEDGQRTVCFEEASYSWKATQDGLLLSIDSRFWNDERDFAFGDQEESGLCIRVAPSLSVRDGTGTILNDRRELNESGTWGREFRWIDYSGEHAGKRIGLLIVPHPENPRPCWSHSRDYGVLVANPFPRQPDGRREPYVKTWVGKGEPYRLRFSVLVYEQ